MGLIAKPQRGLFIGLFGVFTLFGTSMTIVGAALPKILADFSWSYGAAGAVIAASAATYFLGSLFSGWVLRKLGPKATVTLGLAACVLGLAFFATSPSIVVNLLLNALIGAGQGLIEPAVSWCAFKMDEDGTSKPMNLMHGAFAIGAVAGPIALGLIMSTGLSWTVLFRAIAILFALLGLVLAAMPFSRLGPVESGGAKSEGAQDRAGRGSGRASPRGNPAYWLGFLCLLLYVGSEIGISNWIAEYFVRIFGAKPSFASLTVSLFWAGLLAGRFGVPLVYKGRHQERLVVLFSVVLFTATLTLCALGFSTGAKPGQALPWIPSAVTFLAGLGCSIIYPTVISLVGMVCSDFQTESISFAISGGGVGLFVFPFLMSGIAQAYGIAVGFACYAVIAALTATTCFSLSRVVQAARRAKEA